MTQPRILLVEDDTELSGLVSDRLRSEGYLLETAETGPEAIEKADVSRPEIVLLDIMLPGIDGLEVCRRLRARYPLLYIIMLTARVSEIDRVVGLEVGADDYITKPFSLQELVARIRAVMRRIRLEKENTEQRTDEETVLETGDLRIDPVRMEIRRGAELIHLTSREFELLLFLARHPDRPFTRLQLLDAVWNVQYEGYDRTVDSHIQRLRSKIEKEPANPRYIRTVWGVGYKWSSGVED